MDPVTFAHYARRHGIDAEAWSLKRGREKLTPWQDGARASPRVLVLGAYALRVRGGALEIEYGPHDDRQTIRIDIDAEPKPRGILFDSHGEFMTGEALRWRSLFNQSRFAGRTRPIDYDGRKRARNEGEYDDAHARHRSYDHTRAMRGGSGKGRARDRESEDRVGAERNHSRRLIPRARLRRMGGQAEVREKGCQDHDD
jgi:hypothetical protein